MILFSFAVIVLMMQPLTQPNYGGILEINGVPVGIALDRYLMRNGLSDGDGSVMVVIATDAPLSDRNLERLGRRALIGIGRMGSPMTNGSGDYVISFSTAETVRRTPNRRARVSAIASVPNGDMSPLFQAAVEATEEAVYNALFMAKTTTGYRGRTVAALPLDRVMPILRAHDALTQQK